MPPSPQPRRPALTPNNQTLTNGDQTMTKVDTVNPSGTSRTTLNKSEQIRTPPNAPPDKDTLRIAPEHRCRPPAASHPPSHRGEG